MTTNTLPCADCAKELSGIYRMTCRGCRNRLLMDEPCKMLRKLIADSLKKWGEVDEWQIEPHCGCKGKCKRLENMRLAEIDS